MKQNNISFYGFGLILLLPVFLYSQDVSVDSKLVQKLHDSVNKKKNAQLSFDCAISQLADNGKWDALNCVAKQELALLQVPQKEVVDQSCQDLLMQADVTTSVVESVSDSSDDAEPVVQTRKVSLGGRCNAFYLDDNQDPKRFALIGSVYNTFCLNRAFNDCKKSVPMAQVLFGAPAFTIGDVFLLSRLSLDGNLYLTDPSDVSNQYLASVAPAQVLFDANAYEVGADLSLVYRFNFGKCIDVACSVGINVPVIYKTHELDLLLLDSNFSSTTVLDNFFSEFNGIQDFFYSAVLAPKHLTLERKQQKFGFGDVSIFSTFDFAPSIQCVDGLQVGFNLSLPSGSLDKGNSVWGINLGNGAVQLDLFSNIIFNGGTKYFNPTVYIDGDFSFPYTASLRVPQVVAHVSSDTPMQPADAVTSGTPPALEPNIPGLVVPGAPPQPGVQPVFTQYYTTTFKQVNSKVRFFSDAVNQARIKQGVKVVAGVGNYFYATHDCQLRLGVFYDFTAKSADSICVFDCGESTTTTFDTSLYDCKSEYAQRIGWHGAYKLGTCGEFMIGSQHIVAGRNVFKINQVFATFVATF